MKRGGDSPRSSTRCAIYTRKSTEEGLDQAFNTLDAQREACEAYIKSQAGEGWRVLATRYDDGGFSGGNMDRPALKRLLDDVTAGSVDTIVVYKVDRLTRSLMDFVKIVEKLDARNVSFVSVTQAFNTTTSMGRLTLNVLLSFAQFEREVTGERIRDKVAASKAKGIFMGGNLPLGYDLGDRMLVVNPKEARQVRSMFELYLELGSVPMLAKQLEVEGMRSKHWVSSRGREMGGSRLRAGAIYYILQNRLYRGEVVHGGQAFDGEHEAIISAELFDAVQDKLAANRKDRRTTPTRSADCPLLGLVCDATGEPMGTTFGYGRGGKRYRYYVSRSDPAAYAAGGEELIRRVAAAGLERLVMDRVTRLVSPRDPLDWARLKDVVQKVRIQSSSIVIDIAREAVVEPHERIASAISRLEQRIAPDRLVTGPDDCVTLVCERRAVFHGGSRSDNADQAKARQDPRLIPTLKIAHRLLAEHSMTPLDEGTHPHATAPKYQRSRRMMALGLLAPRIQKAVLAGKMKLTGEELMAVELPLAWADQQTLIS